MIVQFFSAILFVTPAAPGDPTSTSDFRKIIEDAKSKVFPALIFVAPVVEEYESGKREIREQGGSGVIISEDGFAVTNWHVVEKALTIRVLLHDGRVTTAKKIGEDQVGYIGNPLKSPLMLKVYYLEEGREIPISNVPIRFSYKIPKKDSAGYKYQVADSVTDSKGIASFTVERVYEVSDANTVDARIGAVERLPPAGPGRRVPPAGHAAAEAVE